MTINAYGTEPPAEPADTRTYPNKSLVFGKLVLTTTRQADGAPVIDGCSVSSVDGWHAGGVAIRIPRGVGKALVVAWIGKRAPVFRAALRMSLVGLLFRMRP